MNLTTRSRERLEGVDTRLVAVVYRAVEYTRQPFQVTEGLRTLTRQRQLVAAGASKTLRSRHLTGHAVDVVAMLGSRISWEFALYLPIRDAMFRAADQLGITLRWGGDWNGNGRTNDESFSDCPHFELPRAIYGEERQAAVGAPPLTDALAAVTDQAENRASTVSFGDRGLAVTLLQRDLETLGLLAPPADGVFGRATAAAVHVFQARAGLKADGVVGPRTRAALATALKARRK